MANIESYTDKKGFQNLVYDKLGIETKIRTTKPSLNRSKPVKCLTNGVIYPSAAAAARGIGKNESTASSITRCCRGQLKQTCGHRWEYA